MNILSKHAVRRCLRGPRLLLLAAVAAIGACQLPAPKPDTPPAASVPEVAPQAPPVTPSPLALLQQELLEQAELAFRQDKLTTPVHDNAYDRFHSVLVLDPGNARARAGLQAILLSYIERCRNALAADRPDLAEQVLTRAEEAYPGHPLVLSTKQAIAEHRRQSRARATLAEAGASEGAENSAPDFEDWPLEPGELRQRSPALAARLGQLAQRLRETDESVLIFARSDAEGRWIYRQLKQAVEGYRVRGDIRHSGQPKIRILPPL